MSSESDKWDGLASDDLEIKQEAWNKMFEEEVPLSGNICKEEGCGGRIIKRVSSYSRGRLSYHPPQCEECGRTYFRAKNVRPVGVEDFYRAMNKPFTI